MSTVAFVAAILSSSLFTIRKLRLGKGRTPWGLPERRSRRGLSDVGEALASGADFKQHRKLRHQDNLYFKALF